MMQLFDSKVAHARSLNLRRQALPCFHSFHLVDLSTRRYEVRTYCTHESQVQDAASRPRLSPTASSELLRSLLERPRD